MTEKTNEYNLPINDKTVDVIALYLLNKAQFWNDRTAFTKEDWANAKSNPYTRAAYCKTHIDDALELLQLAKKAVTYPKYMMAREYQFKTMPEMKDMGAYDICVVSDEDADNYIGSFVYGLGMFGIKFPKSSTRELNEEEIAQYKKEHVSLNGMDLGPVIK